MITQQHINLNEVKEMQDVAILHIKEMIMGEHQEMNAMDFILGVTLAVHKLFSKNNDLPLGYDYDNLIAHLERLNKMLIEEGQSNQ